MKKILYNNGKIALKDGKLPECDADESFRFTYTVEGIKYGASTYSESEMKAEGLEPVELRASWQILGDKTWRGVAKGVELLNFDISTKYCKRCGSLLENTEGIFKVCPECGEEYYPPMNAAIMVLIEDDKGRALLVKGKNFRKNFYGLAAGFVETGETLEECVKREVKEETNLEIKEVEYVESQSWPFPSQLMIGFRAKLAGGELEFADGELIAGGFYSKDDLPPLATPPSLANRLITLWRHHPNDTSKT